MFYKKTIIKCLFEIQKTFRKKFSLYLWNFKKLKKIIDLRNGYKYSNYKQINILKKDNDTDCLDQGCQTRMLLNTAMSVAQHKKS